ncbi:sugar-binding protein [Pseudomonas orientalis]|uniref:Sugar-binding protein n=1 Tax=Pseudomonas orientalis TaxID=76758 RepID=A0A2L0S4C3_9PSED|nr:sugar-binding protein [Pseudomonas orientalis]
MTSKQVGASGTTRYTYDELNRLTSTVYPDATPAITNTYNKNSKLLSSNSAGGNRSFTYDAADNLVQDSLALDGRVFTTRFAYNGNDNLSSITYPESSRMVNYVPDALGRPTSISGYISAVQYWPSGLIQSITYNNGIVSRYGQNSRLWPASFITETPFTATHLSSNYTYDGTGNLKTVSDDVDASFNRTLDYDGINRLTGVAGLWGQGSIAYDGGGNLINQTLGQASLTYAYDANNRLSSVSGFRTDSYGYDAYGNVSSSQDSTYTYNDVPNLVCINCASPAAKVEYSYDGLNHRSAVVKASGKVYEIYDSNGKQLIELDGGTLTEYFYLGDKRVAQQVSP